MEKAKKVIWLGVTPLELHSPRLMLLMNMLGHIEVSFPNTTEGLTTYNEWKNYLHEWDVIATDEEKIDESWEEFFEANKEGMQIIRFKDGEWKQLEPGFSNDTKRKP